jgi:hypothetical protein
MKALRFLGSEVFLGTLIALLSVFTAFASWQGSIADSKQNESEVLGMQNLTDGNAEYLTANQFIVYDYTMFDGWYTSNTDELAAYYEASYSPELQDAIAADPDNPFSDAYYDAMYAPAYEFWDATDAHFEAAGQWDNRGDGLQLVMLIMALGLAFAAWASLLREESNLRPLFSLFALLALISGLIAYLGVPAIS